LMYGPARSLMKTPPKPKSSTTRSIDVVLT
jgi:hypothetical protein